eukprot:m.76051 g.76051  ORF g.76051 m.76051 type:complete len:2013 (-) comp12541_c0_seq1:112-6150(-)
MLSILISLGFFAGTLADTVTCPPGKYLGKDGQCYNCRPGSFSLGGIQSNCILWRDCDPGTYINAEATSSSDRDCKDCPILTYNPKRNSATCFGCTPNKCASGEYLALPCVEEGRESNSQCQPCASECDQCSGPLPSQCLSCVAGLFVLSEKLNPLGEGFCASQCPDGQYMENGMKCKSCHDSCGKSCSGPGSNECLSCPHGLVLADGICLESCPSEEFHRPIRKRGRRADCGPLALFQLLQIARDAQNIDSSLGCLEAVNHVIAGGDINGDKVARCIGGLQVEVPGAKEFFQGPVADCDIPGYDISLKDAAADHLKRFLQGELGSTIKPPISGGDSKLCNIQQAAVLASEAAGLEATYPQFNCGDVLTKALNGKEFADCEKSEENLCVVDLCVCLAGAQAMESKYTDSFATEVDCKIHESHGDFTIAAVASQCKDAAENVQLCETESINSIVQVLKQAAVEFPSIPCDEVIAQFKNNAFLCDNQPGQVCEQDLCKCLGAAMTANPIVSSLFFELSHCRVWPERKEPFLFTASRCLRQYETGTISTQPPSTDAGPCDSSQTQLITKTAFEINNKYPELNCMKVLRAAVDGHGFGDPSAVEGLNNIDLCWCLGGAMDKDNSVFQPVESLNCVLSDGHSETVRETVKICYEEYKLYFASGGTTPASDVPRASSQLGVHMDFELVDTRDHIDGVPLGWQTSETGQINTVRNGNKAWKGINSNDKFYFVSIQGYQAYIEQVISGFQVGTEYILRFLAAKLSHETVSSNMLNVIISGDLFWSGSLTTSFNEYEFRFRAKSEELSIQFQVASGVRDHVVCLDDIVILSEKALGANLNFDLESGPLQNHIPAGWTFSLGNAMSLAQLQPYSHRLCEPVEMAAIAALAVEMDLRVPHLNCGAVFGRIRDGDVVVDCRNGKSPASKELCDVQFCLCLGGAQVVDPSYVSRLEAFDCMLDTRYNGTVSSIASFCLDGTKELIPACNKSEVASLKSIAQEIDSKYSGLRCADAIDTAIQDKQLNDAMLCACIGGEEDTQRLQDKLHSLHCELNGGHNEPVSVTAGRCYTNNLREVTKACDKDQLTSLLSFASSMDMQFPHFKCGDVIGASISGNLSDDCDNDICFTDLCRCLVGIQEVDSSLEQLIKSNYDCGIHTNFMEVTLSKAMDGCRLAFLTSALPKCNSSEISSISEIVTRTDSDGSLGCLKVMQHVADGEQIQNCSNSSDSLLCEDDLCNCFGHSEEVANVLFAMDCKLHQNHDMPISITAAKCYDQLQGRTSRKPFCQDGHVVAARRLGEMAAAKLPQFECADFFDNLFRGIEMDLCVDSSSDCVTCSCLGAVGFADEVFLDGLEEIDCLFPGQSLTLYEAATQCQTNMSMSASACSVQSFQLLADLAVNFDEDHPEFGCGKVMTAAAQGHNFPKCQSQPGSSGKSLCDEDLCRCLGGAQVLNFTLAERLSSLHCKIDDGHDEAVSVTAARCYATFQQAGAVGISMLKHSDEDAGSGSGENYVEINPGKNIAQKISGLFVESSHTISLLVAADPGRSNPELTVKIDGENLLTRKIFIGKFALFKTSFIPSTFSSDLVIENTALEGSLFVDSIKIYLDALQVMNHGFEDDVKIEVKTFALAESIKFWNTSSKKNRIYSNVGTRFSKDGQFYLGLPQNEYIEQAITGLVVGELYEVSFLSQAEEGGALMVTVDGMELWNSHYPGVKFSQHGLTFRAWERQHVLRFENDGTSFVFLDGISVTIPHSAWLERTCSPCKQCSLEYEYQAEACTRNSDTVCLPLSVCKKISVEATKTSDRVCEDCYRCPPGMFDNDKCLQNSDGCQPCASGQYQDAEGKRSCKPTQTCGLAQEEESPPTATSDRVCRACPDGKTRHGYTGTGVSFERSTCKPYTRCTFGQVEAPTTTTDRKCAFDTRHFDDGKSEKSEKKKDNTVLIVVPVIACIVIIVSAILFVLWKRKTTRERAQKGMQSFNNPVYGGAPGSTVVPLDTSNLNDPYAELEGEEYENDPASNSGYIDVYPDK